MRSQVKDLFSSVNKVSDNDDFWNIIRICGLVDTTSDGEKFSLSIYDVYHMVESFGDRFVVDVGMWDGSGDVVLNASICNDKSIWENTWRFDSQVVQLLNTSFEVVVFTFTR